MIILRICPTFSHFYRVSFQQDGSRHPDVLHARFCAILDTTPAPRYK